MNKDEFLVKSFNEILKQAKENLSCIQKDNYEYTPELQDDYSDIIAILEDILPEISGISSLHKLDEEDYAFMFEMLNSYAEVFIIDGTKDEEKLEHDNLEFQMLMDIIEELEKDYVPQDYEYDEEDEDD